MASEFKCESEVKLHGWFLVFYADVQFIDSRMYDWFRMVLPKKGTWADQYAVRIPDAAVCEKQGYLEICTSLLWQAVVPAGDGSAAGYGGGYAASAGEKY